MPYRKNDEPETKLLVGKIISMLDMAVVERYKPATTSL
jgi:hypothetical protein